MSNLKISLVEMLRFLSVEELESLIKVATAYKENREDKKALPSRIRHSNVPLRLRNVMRAANIDTWEGLSCFTREQILRFRNIGCGSVELIDLNFKARGLSFKE